jgi:hypothetical protein
LQQPGFFALSPAHEEIQRATDVIDPLGKKSVSIRVLIPAKIIVAERRGVDFVKPAGIG